jgi:hypothetical protein
VNPSLRARRLGSAISSRSCLLRLDLPRTRGVLHDPHLFHGHQPFRDHLVEKLQEVLDALARLDDLDDDGQRAPAAIAPPRQIQRKRAMTIAISLYRGTCPSKRGILEAAASH